jgi:hypothetical protein
MNPNDWDKIEKLIEEIADFQRKNLLATGRRIVPSLTPEDMLQPNDYLELEHHPHFRYEEGVLAGIQTIQSAVRALAKSSFGEKNAQMDKEW